MIDWIKNNKGAATWGMLAMLTVLTIAAISGCQLSDLVDFDTPKDVQVAIDVPETIPLSKADDTWAEWQAYVERNSSRLASEIDDANYQLGMIQSMTDMGMQALNDVAPGFPGGALLVGGISMMSGLFLKKPGTDKAVSKEREESYQKGLEEGKKIAIQLYEAAQEVTAKEAKS